MKEKADHNIFGVYLFIAALVIIEIIARKSGLQKPVFSLP
jgi:hypothetical protein